MRERKLCSFNSRLKDKYPFLQEFKTEDGTLDPARVLCTICSKDFSVANSGLSDIKKHIASNKHRRKLDKESVELGIVNVAQIC
jgi:hypothetical protein